MPYGALSLMTKEMVIEKLNDEIQETLQFLKTSARARTSVRDLKTHLRGTKGSGRYVILPHWELGPLEDFELPPSWGRFASYHGESYSQVFYLRADGYITMGTVGHRGYRLTTHQLPLNELSIRDLKWLVEHVRALRTPSNRS